MRRNKATSDARMAVGADDDNQAPRAHTPEYLSAIIEYLPSMVFVKDMADGRFLLLNKAGEQLLGVSRTDLIGKTDFDMFTRADAERFSKADRDVVASGRLVTIENEPLSTSSGIRSLRTQKVGIPGPDGKPRYLLGISEDVTERLQVEQHNHHLSYHDALTDLPNRRSFQIALEEDLCGPQARFALLALDLDRFKAINDRMGHLAGDELLRNIADRMRQAIGGEDLLARLGGDEFGIIHRYATKKSAAQLAGRIVSIMSKPFMIEGKRAAIGVSVGVVLSPDSGVTADGLVKRADLALYKAKAQGKGRYVCFDPVMEEKADTERLLLDEMAIALKKSQFEIHYQPIVDTRSGKIVCCEALLRWRHPELGMVPPSDFIPVAEMSGFIEPIGRWVLEHACKEAAQWPDDVRVAVNLSARQFSGFEFAAMVARVLERTKLLPHRLELEITETVFLQDSEENIRVLQALKQLGVRIVLDDFGTGFSSLAYLRKFSFDKLKIDRSFVADLPTSDGNLAIVRAIIGLGRSFSADVTAEGVETAAEHELLAQEGCEQCQGFLFHRPMSGKHVQELLLGRQCATSAFVVAPAISK